MKSNLESLCCLDGGEYWDEGDRLYHYSMQISKTYENGLAGIVFHNYWCDSAWKTDYRIDEKLPPVYSEISLLCSSNTEAYLLVKKDNKYGLFYCAYNYIKECIQTEYDNIKEYDQDKLSGVKFRIESPFTFITQLNKLYGLYNNLKKTTIPCLYESIELIYEDEYRSYYLVEKNGLKGVYNNESKLFIPCLFENIEFINGYFYLTKDKLNGVSNQAYRIVVPIKYEKVVHLQNGIFKIYDNGFVGIYANDTEICQPIYDDIFEDSKFYNNRLRHIQTGNYIIKKGEYIGVVFENKSIIEAKYESLLYLYQNLYAYKQFGKWGIINDKNQIIAEPQYDAIKSGEYGIGVMLDNHYGLIDSKGKIIVPIKYDTIAFLEERIFGRIGRNLFLLKNSNRKQFKCPETFWSDNACGYRNNILLFSYDCNLTSLLPSQND